MKRFCAAILALSLLAAALSGCGAAQSAPETTAAQTTFPTETAAPETTVPETQPTATVDAVPVQKDSQYESAQPGIAEPVITTGQTTVHVSTADEFLAAIASDTEIIVDAELIDFSTASNYGAYGTSEGNYRWNEEFDGPELIIQNVTNLTVRGSGEERTDKVLSCVPRYADVLTFENCANIYVTHITVGHTQEPS